MMFFSNLEEETRLYTTNLKNLMSEWLIPRHAVIVWGGLIGYVDPSSLFTST